VAEKSHDAAVIFDTLRTKIYSGITRSCRR